MRPAHRLTLLLILIVAADTAVWLYGEQRRLAGTVNLPLVNKVTAGLGLTDLCVSTEARYTRHPAVSDPIAPFMDHPNAIEHFPTGSFWAAVPPRHLNDVEKD